LRHAMTMTRRTVITVSDVIRRIHAGSCCPDAACPGHRRASRSPVADALASPGFLCGLDLVLLVGQVRPGKSR
jgi:hypothetical protein